VCGCSTAVVCPFEDTSLAFADECATNLSFASMKLNLNEAIEGLPASWMTNSDFQIRSVM
jgi:hypothetical protein